MENSLLNPPKLMNEDLSYNKFLWLQRLKEKLSIHKFAKKLNINPFHYRLLEGGYIKPNKKDIKKISDYFEIDFNYYLEGFRGYPEELDNKKYNRLTTLMYHLFTKRPLRITFLIIAIISLISSIVCLTVASNLSPNSMSLQHEKVKELNDRIIEVGDNNFNIYTFSYPIVSKKIDLEDGKQKAIIIESRYDTRYNFIQFSQIYWFDTYRFNIRYSNNSDGIVSWSIAAFNYQTYESESYYLYEVNNGFEALSVDSSVDECIKIFEDNNIHQDFTDLIKERLGLDITFDEYIKYKGEVLDKYLNTNIILGLTAIISILLTGIFLFLFGYSSIYKKNKNTRYSFSHSDELFGIEPLNKPVKKDIRFFPFIPETAMRIFGFAMVFIGSLRAVFYMYNISSYSVENINIANQLYSILLMGMFLIFFINFDIYMRDNRLFRNLLIYPMMFFVLYGLEAFLLSSVNNERSFVSVALDSIAFPNPFASAAYYFFIIVFLFVTPSYINTKKKLIIYRSMAIIPILLIIISYMFNYSNFFFGFEITNYWVKALFLGNRFALSLLAVTYLVSLFFIRLFFKKRFGEKNANRYFNGNKFIFLKNGLACVLILLIWIIEMLAKDNVALNNIGIGQNYFIIILAPLIFFYHPHKNSRRTVLDGTLITIYGLVLTFLYLTAGIIAIISLV